MKRFDDILRHWSSPDIILFPPAGTHNLSSHSDATGSYLQASPTASTCLAISSTHTQTHTFPCPHRGPLCQFLSINIHASHHKSLRGNYTALLLVTSATGCSRRGIQAAEDTICDCVACCCLLPVYLFFPCCFPFCFGLFNGAFCIIDTT